MLIIIYTHTCICVFIHSKSPGHLLPILSCVYLALYSQNASVCGCLCVCLWVCAHTHACMHVYVLRIVSRDTFCALKILLLSLLMLEPFTLQPELLTCPAVLILLFGLWWGPQQNHHKSDIISTANVSTVCHNSYNICTASFSELWGWRQKGAMGCMSRSELLTGSVDLPASGKVATVSQVTPPPPFLQSLPTLPHTSWPWAHQFIKSKSLLQELHVSQCSLRLHSSLFSTAINQSLPSPHRSIQTMSLILPSTGPQNNVAQPKADDQCLSSTPPFFIVSLQFKCCFVAW